MADIQKSIRAEYMAHIEKQKSSGLSIRRYCDDNGLKAHKFSYYRGYQVKSNQQKPFAQVALKNETELTKSHVPVDPEWLAQLIHSLWEMK